MWEVALIEAPEGALAGEEELAVEAGFPDDRLLLVLVIIVVDNRRSSRSASHVLLDLRLVILRPRLLSISGGAPTRGRVCSRR